MTKNKLKPSSKPKNQVVIYQTKSGSLELRGDFVSETVWATQAEIARIFSVTPQNITLHLKNIYTQGELSKKATCKESLQVQKEGERIIRRKVQEYNLDVLIAVGYRINSVVGTKFRQWATKILKQHLVQGYTLNKKVILKNHEHFLQSVADIQALLPSHVTLDPSTILDLVKEYSVTWSKLDAYDRDVLSTKGATKKKVRLTGDDLEQVLVAFKGELIRKKEATDIFGVERSKGSITGIVGNVLQGFGGSDVYPSLEEKAAHLLYFMVKNHPLVDGNKRSGAFAFVWFLRRYRVKGVGNINPSSLTALTLLIAESDPKNKEKMVALVVELLQVNKQ